MFDTIYINNCTGELNHSVIDATSITPADDVGTSKDITLKLPKLLPPGDYTRFILNGPCLWFESWSDNNIKDLSQHIEFYLFEVLSVFRGETRYNAPGGTIDSACAILEFDMIDSWCADHGKTYSIYTNEYRMLDSLQSTRYAAWPIQCLDTFSLGYAYYKDEDFRPKYKDNIYLPIQYRFNCFTYRWDQHRMFASALLSQQDGNIVTHYHETAGAKLKWPFSMSKYSNRIINAKNALQHLVPLSLESHMTVATKPDQFLPTNPLVLEPNLLEPYYLKSFCSLVCETNYEYPWGQISEKTINAIRFETPFLLLAGPRSLELLQHWGLKTFNTWWDESYDQEIDPVKRMDAVIKIIDSIHRLSINDLTAIKQDMKSVLLHNRNLYRTGEIRKNQIKAK